MLVRSECIREWVGLLSVVLVGDVFDLDVTGLGRSGLGLLGGLLGSGHDGVEVRLDVAALHVVKREGAFLAVDLDEDVALSEALEGAGPRLAAIDCERRTRPSHRQSG